ncbi:MAG: 30S ribosome-binding factor RbfA [Alphaproteobacteria bacterium]
MRKKSSELSQRCLKVGEEIRRLLSAIFQEEEFWHPELGGHSVIVTEVRLSPDLSHAKVFFVTLNNEDPKKIGDLLKKEKHAIRKILAKKLQLRITPDLFFTFDESLSQGHRIDSLLNDSGDLGGEPKA